MGTANTIAAQQYPQYGGPRLADFNDTQNQAFADASNLSQAPAAANAGAMGALTSAANTNIVGAVQPSVNAATNLANQSTTAATPGGIQSYMSPYTNQVVSGIENLANQNWNNTVMPSVQNSFISAGQFGSGRNAQVLGQAANQWQQGVSADVADALQNGYTVAGNQAATQAGILGTAANTNLSAGQLEGTAAQQQGALQTAAGSALGTLGANQQSQAAQDAAAEQAVGNQQQAQTQSNLDLAYQDFENQAMWPQTQANFMSNIIRGLQSPGTSTTMDSNSAPSAFSSTSPSIANTLSTILNGSSGSSGSGLLFAKGGQVPRSKGALSMLHPHMVRHLAMGGPPMQGPMGPAPQNAMQQIMPQQGQTAQVSVSPGAPQDRASRTTDGGIYIPRAVVNKLEQMLTQKAIQSGKIPPDMAAKITAQQQVQGGAPPQAASPAMGALSQLGG